MTPTILPSRPPIRGLRRLRLSSRVGILALSLCVSLLAAIALAGLWVIRPMRVSAQSPTPSAVGIHKVAGAEINPAVGGPIFVAVIGTDARRGQPGGRAGCDAIHIVAINPEAKAGTILNFPRDSLVGGSKFTDHCRRGGVEAGVATLKSMTGINIQYYVTTEFSHFMLFIDELGGLTVNVPYAMSDAPSGAFFQPGQKHMEGGHVLAFTRNRKDTPRGDFSRTENQGSVILASLNKFKQEIGADPHKIIDYIRVTRRTVKTTVPVLDLLKLGLLAKDVDPAKVVNLTVPGSTGSSGGASVVFLAPGDIYARVGDDAIY